MAKTHAPFIHLRTHSAYSLSEGAIKLPDLVGLATTHQMPALAITDTGNLFCSLEFSNLCAKKGVQPIVGTILAIDFGESYYRDKRNPLYDSVVLFAKDQTGYQHILSLVSQAYLDNSEVSTPHVSFEKLKQYQEGLILLTGGPRGPINRLYEEKRSALAGQLLDDLQQTFGDRLYIELMRHGTPSEMEVEPRLIEAAYAKNIPLVATNDVYFAKREGYDAHDALLCIAQGRYVEDEERERLNPEYYFKSPDEMVELFSDIPEAIENTLKIAQRCAVKSEQRPPMLPHFTTESGATESEELRRVARDGLTMRLEDYVFTDEMGAEEREVIAGEYRDRLEYELDIIINMEFPGYFLIVSDFIRWSKRNNVSVGPGRGSGAGSIVAWCLEITDLDPMRFGLLFERFLNPERVSMPDFDIDFCQERRDEVIRYVQEKYGYDKVAQIITFGTLQARAVLRDVGRVLQLPYNQVDRICKLVPNNPANPVTLQQAIDMEPLLQQARDEEEQVAELLKIALQLEGLNRHVSTHAAGVVIGDRKLEELIPMYRDPRSDMPVVQYSMKYTEAAGLVKFDFLGLKTLTVIAHTCKLIKARGIDLDVGALPFDDEATYALFSKGDTVGVFQFESAGMRDSLRKLKPDTIEDLIALAALYRPGPMDNIPTYIACKHGLQNPDYLYPTLEAILKETFGVIIYQEQVMQIAQILSGYSLGQADLLRRAMGKKIKAEMDAQREMFVKGALEKGVAKKKASEIFDLVAKFAGYGFNKSHAAAYAVIAYQTAYLKAHHPVEFLVASMNLDIHDTDKVAMFCQEANYLGISILPPDINQSESLFSVSQDDEGKPAISYGLGALKNVGIAAMDTLLVERKKEGTFSDVFDVVARCGTKVTNKRQLEHLIKAGAFDSLHAYRKPLYDNLDSVLRYGQYCTEAKESNQIDLFGGIDSETASPKPSFPQEVCWPNDERLRYECDAVGCYLTMHPLSQYEELFAKKKIVNSADLLALSDGTERLKLSGVVRKSRIKTSPRGRYAYVQLSDPKGMFEIAIFDESLLNQVREELNSSTAFVIHAEVRKDEGGMRIIAEQMICVDDFLAAQSRKLHLQIDSDAPLITLQKMCQKEPSKANTELVITLHTPQKEVDIIFPNRYFFHQADISMIANLEGVTKIKVTE